ncbi:1-phosphofructokinase family hexose kinase [Actibacterium pelagium]|uniref:Phosphofructokinase n=1 Tax=Actibacterium pelagium TaxID=2029103 RepID=A0A917AFA3_9RHOB|nr:hexose kinase [Actibacterium pelagium]GGE48103.1 phosphofructokinase [Actibacterium pelagium]
MSDILTITLNPALDISTAVDNVRPGPKLRCEAPAMSPGGGGINVSRSIHILGGSSATFVALAGETGHWVRTLLAEEGIKAIVFEAPSETRESIAVMDRSTGEQYRFVLPGPHWADTQPLIEAIAEHVKPGTLAVISGSNPPGAPDSFISDLNDRLSESGARLLVDTSGAALHYLARAERAPLYVLRMDQVETEMLAGTPLSTVRDSVDLGRKLVQDGVAEIVVLARGAEGSVMVSEDEALLVVPPKVTVRSKIGAGDSFVGAMSMALANGDTPHQAMQKGAAAAAAAVMSDETHLCRKTDYLKVLPDCIVEQID